MIKDCGCEGWKIGWPQLEGVQMLGSVHGWRYEGPFIRFCPWCGKLIEEVSDEARESQR